MLTSWRHSGFNVHCGDRIWPDDEDAMENIARYIIRASFSQERMTYIREESKIVYQSKDGKKTKIFDALEWLAAMCSHVPDRGEHRVSSTVLPAYLAIFFVDTQGNSSYTCSLKKQLLIISFIVFCVLRFYMIKKVLVICLLCCFLTSTFTVQSMAYNTQPSMLDDDPQRANKIAGFKQKFYDANILGRKIVAYKLGNIELTEKEINRIKETLLLELKNCFAELGRAEYQPLFRLIQSRANTYGTESVTAALNTMSTVLQSNLSSEEKTAAGIGPLTIIGAPIGWPIYVLSWVIYFIAKAFEDALPLFGLFLFVVSVIMDIIGTYLIL
jgi:hypothetical protein